MFAVLGRAMLSPEFPSLLLVPLSEGGDFIFCWLSQEAGERNAKGLQLLKPLAPSRGSEQEVRGRRMLGAMVLTSK